MADRAGAGADGRGPSRRLRDHGRGRECARKPERIDHGAHHLLRARTRRSRSDERARRSRGARRASHVAYFRKKGRPGQARRIVEGMLAADVTRISDGISGHDRARRSTARTMSQLLGRLLRRMGRSPGASWRATTDVVVLCEGDPFFYGSFMHLYTRLQGRVEVEVIAGIPGMAGCWNVARPADRARRRRDDGADGHAAGSGARAPRAQIPMRWSS